MKSALRASDPREDIITHLGEMRAFARSLTRNAVSADDLVQDTIEKAWRGFHTFRPGTNLRAWLFTILRNTHYTNLRKTKGAQIVPVEPLAEELVGHPGGDTYIAMIDFERALGMLPVEQREALVLIGASGLSYQDAAQTCGVSIGTIKSRVNRGRARLAALLGRQRDDMG
ncbi:sigma-70 family RNA polymerase sigma factor [Cognatiyoonia sp. IB215182]|uniref:sigma-70 family RNA polymerase sigma factor n=1 Tax=Cognatiyoonia sp. IB215182 TaxID=3097353 RepID=UPI002A14D67D|nr:sigma-70 family RNA polymerase sigma factor [Cognatiyoonia sp. IB215182]MDX8350987.1 sigma-70 family RNA polymerase sigma factor [Cognatiyoonia sp. IB215182]